MGNATITERLLLRPEEAAQMIGVGRSRMYALLASREVPSVRIGRSVRVPVEALRNWVRQLRSTGDESKRLGGG